MITHIKLPNFYDYLRNLRNTILPLPLRCDPVPLSCSSVPWFLPLRHLCPSMPPLANRIDWSWEFMPASPPPSPTTINSKVGNNNGCQQWMILRICIDFIVVTVVVVIVVTQHCCLLATSQSQVAMFARTHSHQGATMVAGMARRQ